MPNKINRKIFGEAIKSIRKSRSIPMDIVADQIDISKQYVSYLERGMKEPSDIVVERIAKYYNIEPQVLFNLLHRIPDKAIKDGFKHKAFEELVLLMARHPIHTVKEKEKFIMEVNEIYKKYIVE
jgi:Helix-turn-helix.